MKKIVGYVIAIVGLVGLASWAVPEVKTMIPYLEGVSDTMLLIISVIVTLLGVLLAMRGRRSKRGEEVPIFQGKNVVGYRRH